MQFGVMLFSFYLLYVYFSYQTDDNGLSEEKVEFLPKTEAMKDPIKRAQKYQHARDMFKPFKKHSRLGYFL